MAIKKRTVEGLISATPVTIGTVSLGAKYAKILAIRAQSYASSAKAAPSTDTAFKLKITDANNDVVYLDASDRDYGTAEITLNVTQDDTATGLGVTPVDATGAAATAGAGAPIVAEGPVQVIVVNGGTATDYIVVELLVEV
jgi:hypothetical protein